MFNASIQWDSMPNFGHPAQTFKTFEKYKFLHEKNNFCNNCEWTIKVEIVSVLLIFLFVACLHLCTF